MQYLIPLFSFAFLIGLYTVYLKLSAKILRSSIVSWMHCFVFSLMIDLLITLGRVATVFSGFSLPIIFSLVYSFVLHLGLGAWFFKKRISSRQGLMLGWRGGMQIAAITYGLFCLTGALFWLILYLAR